MLFFLIMPLVFVFFLSLSWDLGWRLTRHVYGHCLFWDSYLIMDQKSAAGHPQCMDGNTDMLKG